MTNHSLSFDRAVDIYDATRGHPPDVSEQITDSLIAALNPSPHLLEIGIGTGRIARPIAARGIEVTGLDISIKMMRRLLENLPHDRSRLNLIQADASQCPLRSSIFDAVLVVHVLHLIPTWLDVLNEARRLLKPHGSFFSGFDWSPEGNPFNKIRQKWREIIKSYGHPSDQPGSLDFDKVVQALTTHGATMIDSWEASSWTKDRTPDYYIDGLASNNYSSTWRIPQEIMPRCIDDLRSWAQVEFGPLDQVIAVPQKFIWQRFRW